MQKAEERIQRILTLFRLEYPETKIALTFTTPLELLVATILSAQCTDERVNQVTVTLFQTYQRAEDYVDAPLAELEAAIRSTGFYHTKAKRIQETCRLLVERFASQVPASMDALLELPGVARKTANIVLAYGFGVVVGIPVDTHVRRVSQRLGLTDNTDPTKIERDLMQLLRREEWSSLALLLSAHGRAICRARQPLCEHCVLEDGFCPYASSRREDGAPVSREGVPASRV